MSRYAETGSIHVAALVDRLTESDGKDTEALAELHEFDPKLGWMVRWGDGERQAFGVESAARALERWLSGNATVEKIVPPDSWDECARAGYIVNPRVPFDWE